jgi:two-component system response regulator PilR (NtrC family)
VDGGLRIEDVGSRNGIWLAGKRCTSAVLQTGQRVQVGEAWLAVEEVSSSDAQAALVIPTSSRFERDPSASGSAATAEGVAPPGSLGAVLHLARLLERGPVPPEGSGREQLLRIVRTTLGAGVLLVFRVVRGEVAVTECSGAMPEDGVLDVLAEIVRSARPDRAVPVEAGRLVGFVGTSAASDLYLAALSDGPAPPFEPGSAELVSYVAERLLVEGAGRAQQPAVRGGDAPAEPPVPPGMVVGSSAPMRELLRSIRSTIGSDLHVLLLGESGTGKELVARLIHAWGPYAKGPFVPINCAAIPAELFEAEMFGVHGRAATGVDARPGHFARAEGGTIFLDEIGDLREDLQAKLLRALQEREISPVGASGARRINVRVISASNRDLETLVREGNFRQDLYYRLRGRQFHVPLLRERKEDLPEIVAAFVSRFASEHGRHVSGVSRRALRLLQEHDWPGNVRELQSVCEAAVLLCPQGSVLGAEHLADLGASARETQQRETFVPPPRPPGRADSRPSSSGRDEGTPRDLRAQLEEVERRAILDALDRCHGNQTKAANLLGVSRYGLRLKMQRLGLAASKKSSEA